MSAISRWQAVGADDVRDQRVAASSSPNHHNACCRSPPHIDASGRNPPHTFGRSGRPKIAQRLSSVSWMQRTPAGLP